MKNLLIIIFSSFSILTSAQTDSIKVKSLTKKEHYYKSKPKPRPKPKPKFGSNTRLINLEDLLKTEKDSIFYVEEKPYVETEKGLFEVNMGEKIYKIAEEMPTFSTCDSLTIYELRRICSDKAMLEFFYKNVKYPTTVRESGVEGMTVAYFIVEKDGSISRLKVVRDIGADFGEEAMRVVRLFPKFIPAKIDGKPVRVEINLPIRICLR